MTIAQGIGHFATGLGLAIGLVAAAFVAIATIATIASLLTRPSIALRDEAPEGRAVRSHRAGRGHHARTRSQRCPWPPAVADVVIPRAWTRRTRLAHAA